MAAVQKEIDPTFSREAKTREELIALGREINARAGIAAPPPLTQEELNVAVEELQASQRASGIRAEDNVRITPSNDKSPG